MADIEVRFPGEVMLNSIGTDSFDTDIVGHGDYGESVNIRRQYHLKRFSVPQRDFEQNIEALRGFFRAVRGRGKKFRLQDPYDHQSTELMTDIITDTDQQIGVGDGVTQVFQLTKTFVDHGESTVKPVIKPVVNTTVISIAGVSQTTYWSVDTTTGKVTFDADITGAITAITIAASAKVTSAAHGLLVGDTAHIKDVAGMTEINGLRGTVTAKTVNTFTLDIDSSAFTAYTSGGTFHTLPQLLENIQAGYEYDLRVRFEQDDLDSIFTTGDYHNMDSVTIIERQTG